MGDKATREAFGDAMLRAGERHPEVVVVSMDLASATRTGPFAKKYPDRFFEIGIAEQNGIGIAAGLAMEGLRPFICSFGAFLTARYDQIRISCAYNQAPVVLVGTHAGLAIGKDGATQMGIEDVNLMAGIPGMRIFQPADTYETESLVEYLARERFLAYLRLSRNPQPPVHEPGYQFRPGKATVLREGSDLSLLATGDLVYHAWRAAEALAREGIDADVVNFSTLKPIDSETILELAAKRHGMITVEDHTTIGGLGSRVCEVLAEAGCGVRVRRIGINDCFGESGEPADLYRKHGLDLEGISRQTREFMHALQAR